MAQKYVFQVIDSELYTRGIYDTADAATDAAAELFTRTARQHQVNRIPLSRLGHYGEAFDVVWGSTVSQAVSDGPR